MSRQQPRQVAAVHPGHRSTHRVQVAQSSAIVRETGMRVGEVLALDESSKNNGGEDSKNGNVVESEENKKPALIGSLTTQSARVLEITPALENSLAASQSRVPYRKAA